jgi:LSD1 subclass zinc finger protein
MVCATCRKLIAPGARYVRCTVASCNTGRQKLRFCSHGCWQAHVPTARHRKASFVEEGAVPAPPGAPGTDDGGGPGAT